MANTIALTSSMRSNLLSLKNTQSMFDKTQDKMSTGYKVNSAMDNPSSYFTAQALNSRANDLSSLLDSIGQAVSSLEIADKGITTLQDFMEQAKTVANSARDTQNVTAKTTTGQKFDLERASFTLLKDVITGYVENDELIIRTGTATELVGSKATSDDALCSDVFTAAKYNASTAQGVAGTGGNGSLKVAKDEYFLDFKTGSDASAKDNKMVESTVFKVGDVMKIIDYDASDKTKTIVEDANGKRHVVDLTGIKGPDGSTDATSDDLAAGTELTCITADTLVTTFSDDGKTAVSAQELGAKWAVSAAGKEASGDIKTESIIQFKKGLTVKEMANVMEYFIGPNRISIGVEDNNLAIRSLDTSSVEATGDLADEFGLDKGTKIKVKDTDTAEYLRQQIDAIEGVTASFDESGHIKIETPNGDDIVISGRLAQKIGVDGAVTNGSNERDVYAKQFNNLLSQMDELVADTTYKGINLLKGDSLMVNFNEDRTSSLELKGVTFDSNGLGLTKAANRWLDNTSIDKALNQIEKANSMLRAKSSEFGQNLSTVMIRQDFTQTMINNLQSGADKLTLADMNEEAANMLALQTRQQLGVNSLSLASQATQSVLRLF